jgi:integrase
MGMMTLGALDLDGGTVVVNAGTAKSRSRRVVDLSPNAVALLRLGVPELESYWQAQGWNGRREEMPLCPRNFRKRWEALRKAAGFSEEGLRGSGVQVLRWEPDVMRHSFASYHLALSENENRLKAQMGHAKDSEVLWQHYRARVTRREAERFWRIGGAA